MESIVIRMATRNAAFEEGAETEVARILKELAHRIENGARPEKLRDFNGNVIGFVEYE